MNRNGNKVVDFKAYKDKRLSDKLNQLKNAHKGKILIDKEIKEEMEIISEIIENKFLE